MSSLEQKEAAFNHEMGKIKKIKKAVLYYKRKNDKLTEEIDNLKHLSGGKDVETDLKKEGKEVSCQIDSVDPWILEVLKVFGKFPDGNIIIKSYLWTFFF